MSAGECGKTVGILQPGYLPWLGFFEQLAKVDVFVIYDDVQYDKNGWRNRNRIRAGKEPLWLTVPVRASLSTPVNEVAIVRDNWAQKQVKTIRQYYQKAAHYAAYADELFALLQQEWVKLIDLDMALLRWLSGKFEITTPLVFSSELGVPGDRDDRLIEIVKRLGGSRFYEGAAGRNYIDEAYYRDRGVEVVFQDYRHPEYPQVGEGFVSHLSALDLLLNCGQESRGILMREGL